MLPSELLEETWVGRCPRTPTENCLITAWGKATGEGVPSRILYSLIGVEAISRWNDTHTKAEVVAVARLAEMKLGLREMETAPVAELVGAEYLEAHIG